MMQDVCVLLLLLVELAVANLYRLACPLEDPCICHMEVIECSFKQFKEIPYMDFFESWKELDMAENFIESLPPRGFYGAKVKVLNLERNLIYEIDSEAFVGVIECEEVNLSNNQLTRLKKGVFTRIPGFKKLNLGYNTLYRINDDAFEGMSDLEELDLTNNDFTYIPSTILRPLAGLKRLILRSNRIRNVAAYSFYGLHLEVLDLGANSAPTYIEDDAFCGLEPKIVRSEHNLIQWSGLTTLLLDYNGIKSLNPCITKSVWTLATLDVSGNPIHCDCRLFLFRESGTRTSFPGGQCASPPDYAGRYINDIEPTQYTCVWNRTTGNCGSNCQMAPVAQASSRASEGNLAMFLIILVIANLVYRCSR